MTIEINRPEVEALINQRLQSGAFKDAQDVIIQALRSSAPATAAPKPPSQSFADVFEPVRGLADDADFSCNPSTGRPVDL